MVREWRRRGGGRCGPLLDNDSIGRDAETIDATLEVEVALLTPCGAPTILDDPVVDRIILVLELARVVANKENCVVNAAATTFRRGGYLDPIDGCSAARVGCRLQPVRVRSNVESGSSAA